MLGAGAGVCLPTFFTLDMLGRLAQQGRFGRALAPHEQVGRAWGSQPMQMQPWRATLPVYDAPPCQLPVGLEQPVPNLQRLPRLAAALLYTKGMPPAAV